jgi:peptide/nickel transport system permease protein
MLRHALRRLLWIVPILIGVTLASFALLSYVPPPEDPVLTATLGADQVLELKRSRFLDLPRFFNERPVDVQARVNQALADIAAGGELAPTGLAALVKLGGAALPHLLPRLDTLEPAARTRVALALAPVAERMGIASAQVRDPAQAVAFWNRFWVDRGIDYRAATARRAARRLASHGTSMREADLLELDTFALEQILVVLKELTPEVPSDREAIGRLIEAAAHVTGTSDQLAAGASATDAAAAVRSWQEWWLVHRADYTAYGGAGRFLAMVTDTQYAKWAERVVLLGFGTGPGGGSVLDKLRARARPTLLIVTSATALAYAIALSLGVAGAVRRSAHFDVWLLSTALVLCAVPTACLATLMPHGSGGLRFVLAVVTLACAMCASPLAQERMALASVLREDYVRFAKGWGLGPVKIAVTHALRNTLLPIVALFSVDMPAALGGAFVVEKVFDIPGLGEETIRAVETHDVAWLVGLAFISALAVTLTSVASDLLIAAIDPRLSLAAVRHRRMSG